MGHIHPENMGDAAHVPLKVSFDAFDERAYSLHVPFSFFDVCHVRTVLK